MSVDYYHVLDQESSTYICYDLKETAQRIITMRDNGEWSSDLSNRNLDKLSHLRMIDGPQSFLNFWNAKGRPISNDAFFKSYGVVYKP